MIIKIISIYINLFINITNTYYRWKSQTWISIGDTNVVTNCSKVFIFDRNLEIHIGTDKQNRILVIQDTGVGMTREELISNLGTIARSGSKVQIKLNGFLWMFLFTKYKNVSNLKIKIIMYLSYLRECWSTDRAWKS